ncbi:MAG: ATP-binding cassette domain-containing protein [Candidatus Bathyarchaeia archaeon]
MEILRLLKPIRARWIRPLHKFRINIEYECVTEITQRTIGVAEAFGLGIDENQKFKIYDNLEVDVGPRDIVYITGDSGSGKSTLLRWLEEALKPDTINIADIQPNPDKPIIEQVGGSLDEALELLSRAGLNDAFLFIRRYRELSDGQKYRFKIAKMMESQKQYWVLDEFCSLLDRDTAKIVAYNIQKLARQQGKAVLAATSHTDLFSDLSPSIHIHKQIGGEAAIKYYPNKPAEKCSLMEHIRIEEGTIKDYKSLAQFHYRSSRCPPPRKIFRAVRLDKNELCGVIVYSYPPPTAFGRKLAWKGTFKEMQRSLSTISRVIVHPKYRSIGLGVRLVRETLPLAGTPYVEMTAVMAKYNPFAEKAGMQKIIERKPPKEALKIAETLSGLGFNMQMLSSTKYVSDKLRSLSEKEINEIREALIRNSHPRLIKALSIKEPFGKTEEYKRKVKEASLEKITHLIKLCGTLLQTKTYLFWQKQK